MGRRRRSPVRAPAARSAAAADPRDRRSEAIRILADALGVLRIVLAVVFAWTFADGSWAPLAAFAVAAASDYVDGPLARRAGGASAHGVVLDSAADIAFVLLASGSAAVAGRIAWIVPIAIASAAVPYLVATIRLGRRTGGPASAYSAVGHWAGVANYAIAGLVAGSAAVPGAAWPTLLTLASVGVVALNGAAVALRIRR